jgi:RNA polymerase sigma-70 factor (ECF subfamily)
MLFGMRAGEADKARRFRDAALPHLDDVYTLARYLMRNAADADDAVQECYLRAFRHFDGFRGESPKPWLLAILRNVCRSEFARRSGRMAEAESEAPEAAVPLWQEQADSAEAAILRRQDADTLRALLAGLPEQFRETLVLRDVEDLSYQEIAQVLDVPVGTVMSRLARARRLLREAWCKAQDEERAERKIEHKEQSR